MANTKLSIDYEKIWKDLYYEVSKFKSQAQFDVSTNGIGNAALTAYEKVLDLMNEKAGLNITYPIIDYDQIIVTGGNQ